MARRNRQNRFSFLKLPTALLMLTGLILAEGDGDGGGGSGDGGQGGNGDAGGKGPDGGAGTGGAGGGSGSGSGSDQGQVPKAEVERIVQERLAKTKQNQAERLKALKGDRSDEDVQTILAAHDAQIEKDKDEVDRAKDAAAKAETTATEAGTRATVAETREALIFELVMPGNDADGKPLPAVKDRQALETILKLALPYALDANPDEVENPIGHAAGRVRTELEPMFAVPESSTTQGNGSTRPAPGPDRTSGETSTASATSAAVDRYKSRTGKG